MKHFLIYFWKLRAFLVLSISIQITFWGMSFITGMRVITFYCFWYYKKMHISRAKKFSFTFKHHLLFVGYIFQSWHLQAYYQRGFSIVWRRDVPTGNRYVLKCGSSNSDLFLKIETPKKETKSLKILSKELVFSKITSRKSAVLLKTNSVSCSFYGIF